MSSTPDLKIVDDDIQALHRDLKTVADAFAEDTHVADDIGGALGHAGLAKKFADFSESWRVNRERMQKNINELADQMGNIKLATDEVDTRLSENGPSAPQRDGTATSPSSDAPLPPSPTHNSGLTGTGGNDAATAPSAPSSGASIPGQAVPADPAATDPTPAEALAAAEPVVRVGDDGDFYAAMTVGGASAAGATATLMALYKLWDAHRAQLQGQGAPTSEAGQADARTRLLAGLQELSSGGRDVSVELVSDGRSPDHISAILKGEDGSVSVVDLSEQAAADPVDQAVAADPDLSPTADPGTDPGDSPTQPGPGGVSSDGGGAPGDGGSGQSAGSPAADLSQIPDPPGVEAPAGGGAAATSGSASSELGAGGTGYSGPAQPGGLPDVSIAPEASAASSVDQGTELPHASSSTAAMGMAGMGAMSMAGRGGQAAAPAPARSQGEPLRKVPESSDDESAKGKDR